MSYTDNFSVRGVISVLWHYENTIGKCSKITDLLEIKQQKIFFFHLFDSLIDGSLLLTRVQSDQERPGSTT
jgi:hypothetical protein